MLFFHLVDCLFKAAVSYEQINVSITNIGVYCCVVWILGGLTVELEWVLSSVNVYFLLTAEIEYTKSVFVIVFMKYITRNNMFVVLFGSKFV